MSMKIYIGTTYQSQKRQRGREKWGGERQKEEVALNCLINWAPPILGRQVKTECVSVSPLIFSEEIGRC